MALTILTPAALFYLLIVPVLAAQSPKRFGMPGVLFGAFMLIQLFMLVATFALDSAAAFYAYQPWLNLRRRQAQFSPYRSDKNVPPSWALVPMMLSYSAFNYAFAVVYVFTSSIDPSSFSTGKPLGVVESIYFSTITAATIGYGDIAPKTDVARLIVVAQVSISLLYVIILFSAFASYVREQSSQPLERVDRRPTPGNAEPDDGPEAYRSGFEIEDPEAAIQAGLPASQLLPFVQTRMFDTSLGWARSKSITPGQTPASGASAD